MSSVIKSTQAQRLALLLSVSALKVLHRSQSDYRVVEGAPLLREYGV
jgi:hypothetical protein